MAAVTGAIKLLRQRYPDVAIVGKVYGPWSVGYQMVGIENFLMDVMLDPDKIKRYLDAFLPACLASARAQFEAGADAVMWADHTTGDLCRAETYRDFLLEMHQHITSEMGGPGIFHCCGKTIDRVHLFAEAGWDVFHFESQVDAREARAMAGERMALMGNLNNPTLLYQGTPEDVYKACWDLMDAGVDGLAPEGSVPLVTPEGAAAWRSTTRPATGRPSIAATTASSIAPTPPPAPTPAIQARPEPTNHLTRRRTTQHGGPEATPDGRRGRRSRDRGRGDPAGHRRGHPPEDDPRRDDRRDGRGRQRFQDNEIYVPEMLISARAMKAAVALLEPLLIGSGYKPDSVAVMGTIKGDLHDIGKNLVGMMLKGANFEIFDLGTNVSVDKFMAAAREHKADIIGISALLTTTMGGMRTVIEAVRAAEDLPHLPGHRRRRGRDPGVRRARSARTAGRPTPARRSSSPGVSSPKPVRPGPPTSRPRATSPDVYRAAPATSPRRPARYASMNSTPNASVPVSRSAASR